MNNAAQLNRRRFPNAAAWIALLCIAQPVLDILSYWLGLLPHGNAVSLGLRMLVLALTILVACGCSKTVKRT